MIRKLLKYSEHTAATAVVGGFVVGGTYQRVPLGPFFAANVSSKYRRRTVSQRCVHWSTAVVTVQIAHHSLVIGKVRKPEANPAQRKQALCLPSDAVDWQLDFSAGARYWAWQGVVKRWYGEKGFGFIKVNDDTGTLHLRVYF